MALFAEGSFFGAVTDSSSNVASLSSTPPTTVADSASLHSDTPKHDSVAVALNPVTHEPVAEDLTAHEEDTREQVADQHVHFIPVSHEPVAPEPASNTPASAEPPAAAPPVVGIASEGRSRRARVATPIYNLSKLSGTDGHGKRRANGDIVSNRRRRTISGDTLVGSIEVATEDPDTTPKGPGKSTTKAIDALDLRQSPRTRRQAQATSQSPRTSSRLSTTTTATKAPVSSLGTKLSNLGKRSRKAADQGLSRMSRELRRLQDTNEFAHLDDKPVVHTVWSNGKFIDPNDPPSLPRKKAKVATPEPETVKEESEPITNTKKRRVKKYLAKGLYAGQESPLDMAKSLTAAEKKKLAQLPELIPSGRVNKTMPAPLYTGLRTLIAGRDFKLPFQVCNPLPPGQPKPDEWKKMTKNRFIGDSKDYWRKTPHLLDYQSRCVCLPEDGCSESCQNRIMLYECDATNCNAGPAHCTNRAFSDLTARRAKGGKYRVGVEVIKTSDRGYGVRSNRCFEPNQIIMEYAGEIITEEECERRMNEVYKDNECYYLMSFDQNMIIDATTGSIARFVNHSCNPNCRMIKWIVSGKPRMALFAGDRPISTGDELTYDYNFDPFSAKNVQSCLCNEPNCRGVLGPKPREVKPAKTDIKKAVAATVKAGKRKLKELIGDGEDTAASKAKKRKIQPATGVKRSLSNASLKAAKGAATALKKGMSSITVGAKRAALAAKSPANPRNKAGTLLKKTTAKRVTKTYGNGPSRAKQVSSRSSSLTIVALGDETSKPKKKTSPDKKALPAAKSSPGKKTTPGKKVQARKASISKKASPLSKGPRKSSGKQKIPLKSV